jgi:hypothetical protein
MPWLVAASALFSVSACCSFSLDINSRRGSRTEAECSEPLSMSPSADPALRLAARCQAARQIADPLQKGQVLAQLAGEAAAVGQGEIVKQCVGEIKDPFLRADTAGDCAVKLAKAGQEPTAIELVHFVENPMRRDAILAKVAAGQADK